MIYLKRILIFGGILTVLLLVACGGPTDSTGNVSTPPSTLPQQVVNITPTLVPPTSTSPHSTPGTGPILILSPTRVPGGTAHSQLVTLPDRTLAIENVSKGSGADTNSTAISLVMMIKNIATKSIMNEASYFQLVGSEGDVFGLQSSATASFFGIVASQSSRSGTIVFQVPTAAINGLRLMYRSEIAAETVFVALQVQ